MSSSKFRVNPKETQERTKSLFSHKSNSKTNKQTNKKFRKIKTTKRRKK